MKSSKRRRKCNSQKTGKPRTEIFLEGAKSAYESAKEADKPILADLKKGPNLIAHMNTKSMWVALIFTSVEQISFLSQAFEAGLAETQFFSVIGQSGAFFLMIHVNFRTLLGLALSIATLLNLDVLKSLISLIMNP